MTWTNFIDRRSGGHSKTEWDAIAIEAERTEAIAIFERLLPGVNPFGERCQCCGEDYEIEERDEPRRREQWDSRSYRVLTLRAPDYVMTAPWCTYTVNGAVAYHYEIAWAGACAHDYGSCRRLYETVGVPFAARVTGGRCQP